MNTLTIIQRVHTYIRLYKLSTIYTKPRTFTIRQNAMQNLHKTSYNYTYGILSILDLYTQF